MSIRCVMAGDDDINIAGNLLADADFFDGDDGEVDAIEGVNPTLMNIIVWENCHARAANTNRRARGTFQMNTWPNTKRETIWGSRSGGIVETEAATEGAGVGTDILKVYNEKGMGLEAGDDWISDNSYLYSSVNATIAGCMFVYSYGPRYPFQGGHMQWIRKVADAAETGADAFYQAWATDLTGVAPGLDPKKNYVLRGVCHEAAATAKGAYGAFAQPQASAFKLFGPSWGDFAMCVTMFMDDGIPVTGGDGFVAKTASGTGADTPYVWLGFEEYGASARPGSAGGIGKPSVGGVAGSGMGKVGGSKVGGILRGLMR